MKQKIFAVLLIFGLAGMAAAQGRDFHPELRWRLPHLQFTGSETISGELIVAHGMPALRYGNTTYLIGGLGRIAGFVEGITEGAEVIVEGPVAVVNQDSGLKFLRAMNLTLNERSYCLTPPAGGRAWVQPRQLPHRPLPRHHNAPPRRQHRNHHF